MIAVGHGRCTGCSEHDNKRVDRVRLGRGAYVQRGKAGLVLNEKHGKRIRVATTKAGAWTSLRDKGSKSQGSRNAVRTEERRLVQYSG